MRLPGGGAGLMIMRRVMRDWGLQFKRIQTPVRALPAEITIFQTLPTLAQTHKLLEIRTFSNDAAFDQLLLEIRMVQFKQKIGQGVFSKVYFL